MSGIFYQAQNTPESIGNWNTNNATNMSYVSSGAQNVLESIVFEKAQNIQESRIWYTHAMSMKS